MKSAVYCKKTHLVHFGVRLRTKAHVVLRFDLAAKMLRYMLVDKQQERSVPFGGLHHVIGQDRDFIIATEVKVSAQTDTAWM